MSSAEYSSGLRDGIAIARRAAGWLMAACLVSGFAAGLLFADLVLEVGCK